MTDGSERAITIKSAIDLEIVGENIHDIVDFAIEKYEFRNDTTLSAETREAARAEVRSVLWKIVEEIKLRRRNILQMMFDKADQTVKSVADRA
jgi:hypothetical protein